MEKNKINSLAIIAKRNLPKEETPLIIGLMATTLDKNLDEFLDLLTASSLARMKDENIEDPSHFAEAKASMTSAIAENLEESVALYDAYLNDKKSFIGSIIMMHIDKVA